MAFGTELVVAFGTELLGRRMLVSEIDRYSVNSVPTFGDTVRSDVALRGRGGRFSRPLSCEAAVPYPCGVARHTHSERHSGIEFGVS